MAFVNALIGAILVILTALQLDDPHPAKWAAIYFAGAALAVLTLRRPMSLYLIRFLAVTTTGMMFFYFGAFFLVVPGLDSDWYLKGQGGDALGLLFAGFAMIPVLAAYSCRMESKQRIKSPRPSVADPAEVTR